MADFEVIVESRSVHGGPTTYYDLADECTVSGITYSTRWGETNGGGCGPASFKADLPEGSAPYWLTKGALLTIYLGPAPVWSGEIHEITLGNPWEVHCKGLAELAEGYMAADATWSTGNGGEWVPSPTSVPRTAVRKAIDVYDLPWLLPDPTILSDAPFVGGVDDAETVMHTLPTLLNAWCESQGTRWGVWLDRKLEVKADPTTPAYVARGIGWQVAVADENFVTHLHVRYITDMAGVPPVPTAYAWVTVGDDTIPAGERVYRLLDLAPTMTIMGRTGAIAYGQSRLDLLAPRTGWTNPLTIGDGQLFTFEGAPAHPATLEAGTMIRVEGVYTPDQMLDFRGYADILLAGTEYNGDAGTVTATPFGLVARDFGAVLDVAVNPEYEKKWTQAAIDAYAEEGAA